MNVVTRDSSPVILTKGHINASIMFLRQGLPITAIDNDQTRLIIAFYCLATLDVLGVVETSTKEAEREDWQRWLWLQQVRGSWGAGFRGSPYNNQSAPSEYDPPFLIMTYAALVALAILRDPFTALDREGILRYLKLSQREDGSFKLYPSSEEYDLRMTYCAFAICSMLDDWSSINTRIAVEFIQRCRTYEGGYGQEPLNEAHGGSTYCALASLHLLPKSHPNPLTAFQREQTLRWLLYQQNGGFSGRTNKVQDACYCFWCGASTEILGKADLVNEQANAAYLSECQFRFGGIGKEPDSRADPYHTYLGLACLNILSKNSVDPAFPSEVNPLWNATTSTKKWIEGHLHAKSRNLSA